MATKAEGRGPLRHARGCPPEFVGEDGATRRDSGLHCLDEDVDAPAIERRKPARLNESPLSVDDVCVERGAARAQSGLYLPTFRLTANSLPRLLSISY